MLRILVGVFGGLVLAIVVAALVMWSGVVDVSAAQEPDAFDAVAGWAADRAIDHSAPPPDAVTAPSDAAAVDRGLGHFGAMCAMCHGAPGVEAVEFIHHGLLPAPPDLADDDVQERSDAELLWIVENGIRASGMPAFGSDEGRDELLELVAAVRRLPELSDREAGLIRERMPALHGEHEDGGSEAARGGESAHDGRENEHAEAPMDHHEG